MTFKFECPACGQRIAATNADVGTIGVCPSCGVEFEVPRPASPPPLPVGANGKWEARGGLMLACLALALCNTQWLTHLALQRFSDSFRISPTGFVVVMSAPCLLGVICGHRARRRSVGQRAVRLVSTLSLVIGYLFLSLMVVVAFALATGAIPLYKEVTDVPDFVPYDGHLVPPELPPSPTPVRKIPPIQ